MTGIATILAATSALAALAPQPLGDTASWITTSDYPSEARRLNAAGLVSVRLDITRRGKPSKCTVTTTSWNADLDARSCKLLMRRARFTPATDGEGRPVAGTYQRAVRWVLENPEAAPLSSRLGCQEGPCWTPPR